MVRGLWDRQVDTIIDVKIGDADSDMYKYEPTTALLTRQENIKKEKHRKHCHDQRIFFTVCSFSGRNYREENPTLALSIEFSNGKEK